MKLFTISSISASLSLSRSHPLSHSLTLSVFLSLPVLPPVEPRPACSEESEALFHWKTPQQPKTQLNFLKVVLNFR